MRQRHCRLLFANLWLRSEEQRQCFAATRSIQEDSFNIRFSFSFKTYFLQISAEHHRNEPVHLAKTPSSAPR